MASVLRWGLALAALALVVAACNGGSSAPTPAPTATPVPSPAATTVPTPPPTPDLRGSEVVVYSGRSEVLVQPVLDAFAKSTGIKVRARYASTGAIAATILEEGRNSPADVVLMQDAGALGALSQAGLLDQLSDELLARVDPRFRSPKGEWVGVSGRARVVVYNTKSISPERDLPSSILGFTDPKWRGRIGWAPTNGSFQAFVTALRLQLGDAAARQWLEGIKANRPKDYPSNPAIVTAVATGEIDVGFVNHYYVHEFIRERGLDFQARNFYFTDRDIGAMVNVAGAGILKSSKHKDAARRLLDYLLGPEAQTHFAKETFEFPLIKGVPPPAGVPPLESLDPPKVNLGSLADLNGTLELMRKAGVLG